MAVSKMQLAKLKDKMPKMPAKGDEGDDMFMDDEEEGETPEHEAGESAEFEAGEHEEMEEGAGGMEEGTPEEEAVETEKEHTAELSDEDLLAEVKKRGLMGKAAKMTGKGKAVAVSPDEEDEEADMGY